MAKKNKLKAPKEQLPKRGVVHDRRAIQVPAHADIAAVDIYDPFQIADGAQPVERNGVIEWVVPPADRITVVKSLKRDPIGKMHARKQIGDAEHDAACALQKLHDQAQLGVIKAMDPAKDYVDGGILPDPLTTLQAKARARIKAVEKRICQSHGAWGLSILNAVLIDKWPVEAAARARGAMSRREIEYWTGLFHQCLYSLGIEMGTRRGVGLHELNLVPSPDVATTA